MEGGLDGEMREQGEQRQSRQEYPIGATGITATVRPRASAIYNRGIAERAKSQRAERATGRARTRHAVIEIVLEVRLREIERM